MVADGEHAPPMLTGFKVELIEEEELVLVRTVQKAASEEPHYVHVDWDPQFAASQALATLATDPHGLMVGLGPLGLSYILRAGGSGYFRKGAVKPYLETGEPELVAGAPRFTYPAYAVYAEASTARAVLPIVLDGLKQVVR
ncbi:hypothetical protein [Nitratireductor aquibiodomus]|uniref:hypothetical protein n=1 Tax=Nitratireductor aquibiodomus TaxID=204799 RepID=UPI000A751E35|nr:hypothetical protein [Nitratireductor aquibiodomus]